jgi:hypothetical protein
MSRSLGIDLWIILYVVQHVHWSAGMWRGIPLNVISFHWPDRIGKICLDAVSMAIDVYVTGNWSVDPLICCITWILMYWNVKGDFTHFWPHRIGNKCFWYCIDDYWCLGHWKLICRSYYMLCNMCINLLECEEEFHSMQFFSIDWKE